MITIADVTTYVSGSLKGADWEFFPKQQEAINDATKIINGLSFEDGVVPVNNSIDEATILITLDLANGINPEDEYNVSKVKSTAFAGVRTTYAAEMSRHVSAGVTSIDAWRLLLPYLDYTTSISLHRV